MRRLRGPRAQIDSPNGKAQSRDDILRDVIETLNMVVRKVKDMDGRIYSSSVRPYRTSDDRIDGAMITLVDFNETSSSGVRKAKCRCWAAALLPSGVHELECIEW